MSGYQGPEDLKQARELMRLAPTEANAFLALKASAERDGGAIPPKYRELISLGVALTTQCAYCIDAHVDNAVHAGATQKEIAETVLIAAALRAGAVVGHGLMAMRLYQEKTVSAQAVAGDGGTGQEGAADAAPQT